MRFEYGWLSYFIKMENKKWYDIPRFEGKYQISKDGNVYSLKANLVLNPSIGTSGYYFLSLHNKDKSIVTGKIEQTSIYIHKLMAMTFLNYKPNTRSIVIDHINNNKLDNRLINLQITTNRQNSFKDRDAIKQSMHCIYKGHKNNHIIRLKIGKGNYSFGTYSDLDEAKKVRDEIVGLSNAEIIEYAKKYQSKRTRNKV
jgi:hypothetical protein